MFFYLHLKKFNLNNIKKQFYILILFAITFACNQIDNDFENSSEDYKGQLLDFQSVTAYNDFIERGITLDNIKNYNPNFRVSSNGESKNQNFQDLLNEDNLIKIGEYFFKIDLNKGFVSYVKDKSHLNLLINDNIQSEKVKLFSIDDDVLFLLENNIDHTISSFSELEEYNLNKKLELEKNISINDVSLNNSRIISSFTFTGNTSTSNPLYNIRLTNNTSDTNLGTFANDPNCTYIPSFGFPNGISTNGTYVWRLVDSKKVTNNFVSDFYGAICDLTYVRAGVYFELRTDLRYVKNSSTLINPKLTLINDFIYERRVRFSSNEVRQESNKIIEGINTGSIRNFIYPGGSRSLVYFKVRTRFEYDDIAPSSNCQIGDFRRSIFSGNLLWD